MIPGYRGSPKIKRGGLIQECERIGYPVICKATAGGGGRGLKVVIRELAEAAPELIESVAAARGEERRFGSDRPSFSRKNISSGRQTHRSAGFRRFFGPGVRAQSVRARMFGTACRHQKIIEEALSPALDDELREKIHRTARDLAQAAKYRGAGSGISSHSNT